MIGTLAVDGWAVTFGIYEEGPGRAAAPSPLLAIPNVTTSVPTSYYSMCDYDRLCIIKGSAPSISQMWGFKR